MLIHGLDVVSFHSKTTKKNLCFSRSIYCCPFSFKQLYCKCFSVSISLFFTFRMMKLILLYGLVCFALFFRHCEYLLEIISWWWVESVQTLYLAICKYYVNNPQLLITLPVNKRKNEDIICKSFHITSFFKSPAANSYSSLWLWDKLLT